MGEALLVLAGILVVAGGLEAGRRAVRLDFRERFTAEHMSRALAMVTRALGAFGLFCYGLYCLLVNPRTSPSWCFIRCHREVISRAA
jgi:hypothetical protein